jgi:hypothetical protein
VSRQEILRVAAPAGSGFKGYRSCFVRDLVLRAELVHYRRECWVTPDGRTMLAALPAGIVGGYGANLRRVCLMLHTQGQVTTGRLTTLLNDIGLEVTASSLAMIATKRPKTRWRAEDWFLKGVGIVEKDDGRLAEEMHCCEYLAIGAPDRQVQAQLKEP